MGACVYDQALRRRSAKVLWIGGELVVDRICVLARAAVAFGLTVFEGEDVLAARELDDI